MNKEKELNDSEVLVDAKNQQVIRDILKVRQEMEIRLQLVLQILINSKNLTGNYTLSNDLTRLVKINPETPLEVG